MTEHQETFSQRVQEAIDETHKLQALCANICTVILQIAHKNPQVASNPEIKERLDQAQEFVTQVNGEPVDLDGDLASDLRHQ